MTKFTDHQLKVFFSNMLKHYQECQNRRPRMSVVEVYDDMYRAAQYSVESPHGALNELDPNEKTKVYQAFNAIFYAFPIYRDMSREQKQAFRPARPSYTRVEHYHCPGYYKNSSSDYFLTWLLLSNLSNRYSSGGVILTVPGPIIHTHPDSSKTGGTGKVSEKSNQVMLLLLAAVLALAAATLAFVALAYMIHQFTESVERLWYNEGWLKAVLMLATTLAFGATSTVLSLAFAATPITALALAAGLNPVGLVIFGVVSLTLIGGALACWITSLIYDSVEANANQDAIDPYESKRFRLTPEEELNLIHKGIDPIKVKCALVALRAELGDNPVPSFFSRHFGTDANAQKMLMQVRDLRAGQLKKIQVGSLTFDCAVPAAYFENQPHPPLHDDLPPSYYSVYLQEAILPQAQKNGAFEEAKPLKQKSESQDNSEGEQELVYGDYVNYASYVS